MDSKEENLIYIHNYFQRRWYSTRNHNRAFCALIRVQLTKNSATHWFLNPLTATGHKTKKLTLGWTDLGKGLVHHALCSILPLLKIIIWLKGRTFVQISAQFFLHLCSIYIYIINESNEWLESSSKSKPFGEIITCRT